MLIFFSIYTFYVNFKNKYILKLNKHETLTQILVNSSRNSSSIFFILNKLKNIKLCEVGQKAIKNKF